MRSICLLALAGVACLAQGPPVGVIDIYGRRQVSEEAIRKALGVKLGDSLPRSKGDAEEAVERVDKVTAARLEALCCEDGKAILYIGVEERGAPRYPYREPPAGTVRLPEEMHDTYVHFLASVGLAVRGGETGEDLSNGHSLMHHKESRAWQERFIGLAEAHLDNLRDVLRSSYD